MSKADEMFKELGYVKEFERDDYIKYNYIAEKESLHYYTLNIQFNMKAKSVIKNIHILDDRTGFNMQELKAINEKCKELGWLDD